MKKEMDPKPVMLCILDHEKHNYIVVGVNHQSTMDSKNEFGKKFEKAMENT